MAEGRASSRRTAFWIVLGALIVGFGAYFFLSKTPTESHEVKVGTILDLTGPAASFGRAQLQGLQLAEQDIKGSKCASGIRLIVEDSRLDPRLALSAVNKLTASDKVSAITSVTGSSMALLVAPVANRANVPILDSLSSAPALTSEGGDMYFRIQPPDTLAGRYLVQWASDLGYRNAVTIYADSDWGQGLRDAIRDSAAARGLTIALEEPAKAGDVDFRALVARLKKVKPDVIFLVVNPQEAGQILKQARQAGFTPQFMGSDSLSTDDARAAGGDALNGVRFILSSEGSGDRLREFQRKFQQRFGTQPSANSIKPYDALMLLHQVICKNGSKPSDVAKGLRELEGFQGVSGMISFDRNGDIKDPAYDRFVYRNGQYEKM